MKKLIFFVLFMVFYVVTCVPVGLFIYSMKSDLGINIFSKTGYHAYIECLSQQIEKIDTPARNVKKLSAEDAYKKEIEEKAARSGD